MVAILELLLFLRASLFNSLFYHYTSQKNKLCLLKILESVIFFCFVLLLFLQDEVEEVKDK